MTRWYACAFWLLLLLPATAADFAAQPWMPHYWFRNNITSPEDKALSFAHIFM